MSLIGLITVAVALFGVAAALVLPAARAVAVYLVILLVWPAAVLLNPVGTVGLDPTKIIILFLLPSLILKDGRLRGFKPNALDLAIVAMVIAEFVAGAVNIPAADLLEHQGNAITRTVFAYLAIRLGIQTRAELFLMLRAVVYAGGFLACVCLYEMLTGTSMYHWLIMMIGGYEWRTQWPPRFGLYRAVGSFNNPLPMGLFFAFLAPAALILRSDPRWKAWKTILFVPLILGGLVSTMSSGPVFALASAVAVIAFYPFRIVAPLAAAAALTLALGWVLLAPQLGAVSLAEAVSAGTYDPTNASYRARLVEEAFTGGMDDHWVFGFGRVGLGTTEPDSPDFNWVHQDLVNMWILSLVFYGLFGAISLLLVNLCALGRLGMSLYVYSSPKTDFAVWLLLAGFIGWHVAFMAVAPLAPLLTFHYAMIGVISNMPLIVQDWQEQEDEPVHETVWTGRRMPAAASA